jgi:hypothetical protein
MTVALRATNPARRLVEIPLDVPHGARVVAMTITHGDGRTAKAVAASADDARMRWREHVKASDRDPALLEYEETRNGLDRLNLRVYPVLARQAATIELALEVRSHGNATLELDPRNQTVERLDVRVGRTARTVHAWKRVELVAFAPSVTAPALPATTGVTGTTSLVASAPPLVPPVVLTAPTIVADDCFGSRKIPRIVKRYADQLRRCYMAVAQWSPVEGDVLARFRIDPTGRVSAATVISTDGLVADPRILRCLEGVFASIEFPPDRAAAQVSYPLRLRLAD